MIMMGSPMLLTPSALLVSGPLREVESAMGKRRAVKEDVDEVVDESPAAKKALAFANLTRGYLGHAIKITQPREELSVRYLRRGHFLGYYNNRTRSHGRRGNPTGRRHEAQSTDERTGQREILRLRLGLAGYKLRTGQTTIPLSELQRKPLPPSTTSRRRANTLGQAARTNTHNRVRSVDSIPQVPALSQESSTTSAASDAITMPASQESVIVETRGNTPDHLDAQGAGVERDKPTLLPIGEFDSPSKVFQSSPAPAPVSSLRSTCTETMSTDGDRM
ncbi:whi5 like domain-containing [Trichoderma cornu-damae]|uniref:Whi5 like domain-containing n=1 Tax=Trichoderma cornu-damae TaxID=654480 RepID=A0A9P8QQL7_9HYPO|nr:whi5 like domain-containing [Trichoderma cornu-damae]